MLNHKWSRVGAVVGAVLVTTLAGGCGTSLLAGDSQSVLDLLSNYGITEDMTIADALNQITVGDVVSAFVNFIDQATSGAGMPFGCSLTDDQLAELESLQAQLDSGEITEAEFSDAVHEIIGNRGAGMAFAGFSFYGSPFGHRMGTRAAVPLELTDEQQAAAEEIFQLAHDDIDALREAAHDEIRALLTEEQLAILDEMGMPADYGVALPMRHGPLGFGGHGRFGHGGFGPDQFADELQLTDEQQTAIDGIRAALRDAIQARHEQARDEFLSLLTDEQLELLGCSTETDQDS